METNCGKALVNYLKAVTKWAITTNGYYEGKIGTKCGPYGTHVDPKNKDQRIYQCTSEKEFNRNTKLKEAVLKAEKLYIRSCTALIKANPRPKK